jgi:uncharacterized membrane protein YiaA
MGGLGEMTTNHTSHGQIVNTGPTTEPVAWQFIFFALVTFCINTMAQPAGAVCGGEPSLGSMLRCSPVICLVDTCYMMCRLTVFYLHPKRRPGEHLNGAKRCQQAHFRLLRLRYQPWAAGETAGVDAVVNLQQQKVLRTIGITLIGVGAAKFLSSEGLYWSKAIAVLHLGSFAFVELLLIWPRGDEFALTVRDPTKTEKPIRSSGALSLSYISVALAVVFLCFCGARIITDLESSHHLSPKHFGVAAFSSWALPLLFTYLMCILSDDLSIETVWPTMLLILMFAIPGLLYAFSSPMAAAIGRSLLTQVFLLTLGMFWAGVVGTKFASVVTAKVRDKAGQEHKSARQRRIIEKSLAWYFVLLHFLTALLYLRFKYDATDTRSAPWSKVLGR